MKIYIELTEKEIHTYMTSALDIAEEVSDMPSINKIEIIDKCTKAFRSTYKIKNDVVDADYEGGKITVNISEKFICRLIKKTTFLVVGLKSVLKGIIEMVKSWASGAVGMFTDLEEEIGETKVWIDGKEIGAEEDDSGCKCDSEKAEQEPVNDDKPVDDTELDTNEEVQFDC